MHGPTWPCDQVLVRVGRLDEVTTPMPIDADIRKITSKA
jgi:hypothetical protein